MERKQAETGASLRRREFLRSAVTGATVTAGATGAVAAQSDGDGTDTGGQDSTEGADDESSYRKEEDSPGLLETVTPTDIALGGGSGILMTVVLYTLARRRDVQVQVAEMTVDDGSDDGVVVDQPPELDDQLDDLERKIKAARVPYEEENYDRALELCDEALELGEEAIETARAEAPARVESVQSLHEKANELRETVWQEWNETQPESAETTADPFDERLVALREKISAARAPYERGEYDRALDRCDEAIHAAEDAVALARAEEPDRLEKAESLHDMATRLRETIWQQRNEQLDADDYSGEADPEPAGVTDESPADDWAALDATGTQSDGNTTDTPDWSSSGGAADE